MSCRDFEERVDELIDGLLPDADAQALRAHAADCRACASELARAERFREFLATSGRAAVEDAVARRVARIAQEAGTSAGVERPRGRVLRLRRAAVAAALLVAVVAGWGAAVAMRAPQAPTQLAEGASAALARGETRVLAAGRSMLVDEEAVVEPVAGSGGERIRLASGAATFQVETGRPFTVETPQGDATVLGTLFHVQVRKDRSVSVSVMSGVVRFDPRRGGEEKRTLRAGTVLDVDAAGRHRVVSRAHTSDLELRVGMQGIELDALRGEVQRLEDALSSASAGAAANPPAPPAPVAVDADAIPWDELGAAARRLLQAKGGPNDPQAMRDLSVFTSRAPQLRDVTGSAVAWEWPLHPAVLARAGAAFFAALSPEATPEARAETLAAVVGAATHVNQVATSDPVPAELATARLEYFRALVESTWRHLGDAPAAEIARSVRLAREGIWVRSVRVGADPAEDLARVWTQHFDLAADQRAVVVEIARPYSEQMFAAQRAIVDHLGAEEGEGLLYPEIRRGRRGNGETTAPPTEADSVQRTLRRINAKIELLRPRIALERGIRAVLRPEQASKGFPGWWITTLRE